MRMFGAMKRLWNVRAKRELYERVVVSTMMYGSEAWGQRVEERRELDVMEMRCAQYVWVNENGQIEK